MSSIVPQGHEPNDNLAREPVEDLFKLGNWFWVVREDHEWLGCVMGIGSNYLELHQPSTTYSGYHSARIHFTDAHTSLRYEPNPGSVILNLVNHYKGESQGYLNEIQAISARLGVSFQPSLGHNTPKSAGSELMVLSSSYNVDDHKTALIKAKEVELPELFKKLKDTNEELARWLSAESMPLKAVMSEMKDSVGVIDDHIFNISLYAGLAEECVMCSDGEPAEYHEKLHVMQRRLYMDEESLMDYRTGGMEFNGLRKYDQWISKPINRDRIMPFPRCIVAMRVRRFTKDREPSRCITSSIVRMNKEFDDKLTYLYIRNGEKVYRLICEIDFDEMIFPDHDFTNKPLMIKMFGRQFDRSMTRDEYDVRVQEMAELKIKSKQWKSENPLAEWKAANPNRDYDYANPFRESWSGFDPKDWTPFDSSNVYFDDCAKAMAKQAKHFNYIALIIQGLFDRSDILHPHPKVKTWEPESFAQSIELIYDASRALSYGKAPSFEEYRSRCNASFTTGSLSSGQQVYWEMKEAEKECRRLDASWRDRESHWRPTRFTPEGNPGPGFLAVIEKWSPRTKQAQFRWMRDRIQGHHAYDERYRIETTITVPAEEIFNVSAYKKGDYLQFFRDPRTREKYLQWAPLLMEAEDYVRSLEENSGAN
jgi:hypothetical protein